MRAFLLDGGQAWIRTMEAQAQQIYSLSPLATWVPTHSIKMYKKSRREVSNPRPADYKSAALPAELHRRESSTQRGVY